MKRPFSYAVIGTGGVGGYYGALLQRSGKEVHFLLHSDYEYVKDHGLTIVSKNGDFALSKVNAYGYAADLPRCDVAVVALKATANDILQEILPRVLGEKGIVLLLQNGYGQEERIAEIPGVKTIIAGLCFVCTAKVGPGSICHQDYGAMRLARFTKDGKAGGITEVMKQVSEDMAAAGVPVDAEPDLIEARWRKLVWNIPFSGLTTLFKVDTASVINNRALRRLAEDIMHEVAEGASALGRKIPKSFLARMMTETEKMRPYYPSMKLDFDAGKEMELEAMYKKPIDAAASRGKRLIRIEMLYEELVFLQDISLA